LALGWRCVGVLGRFSAISSILAVHAAVSEQLPAKICNAAVQHLATLEILPGQSRSFVHCTIIFYRTAYILHRRSVALAL